MKKSYNKITILLSLFFLVSCYSQKNSCSLQIKDANVDKNGFVGLEIKNNFKNSIRVPINFNPYYAAIFDIQFLDVDTNLFLPLGYSSSDVNCSDNCFGKLMKLKNNKIKIYEIDIRNNFPYKRPGTYKFKIAYNTYLFSGCPDFISKWYTYKIDP